MSKIVNLYKEHINKDADISEIHLFLIKFDVCLIQVPHPDREIRRIHEIHNLRKEHIAIEWILKNSKLTINEKSIS